MRVLWLLLYISGSILPISLGLKGMNNKKSMG